MIYAHVKLIPEFQTDIIIICRTCGYWLDLYKDIDLFNVSGIVETAHSQHTCTNCLGGRFNYHLAWTFVQALRTYVHSNCLTHAPYPDILQVMYEERSICECRPVEGHNTVFSFGKLPLLCSNCGLLFWPDAFDKPIFFNVTHFSYVRSAQLKLLRKLTFKEITFDRAFFKRGAPHREYLLNFFHTVKRTTIGERPVEKDELSQDAAGLFKID